MRLIDARELIKNKVELPYNGGIFVVYPSQILSAPVIDAVPVVHGEWIYTKKRLARGGYVDASECSICHKLIMPHLKPNYCPNCGAKMDGERKDDV